MRPAHGQYNRSKPIAYHSGDTNLNVGRLDAHLAKNVICRKLYSSQRPSAAVYTVSHYSKLRSTRLYRALISRAFLLSSEVLRLKFWTPAPSAVPCALDRTSASRAPLETTTPMLTPLRMTSCIVERRPRYKDANCFHSYWASYWVLVYCSRTDYKGYVRLVGSALFINRASSVSAEALSRSRPCALRAVYDRTVED